MYKIVKWLVAAMFAIFALFYLTVISVYYYGLSGLPENLSSSKASFSVDLLRAKWVAAGERGEIQMSPLSPVGYIVVAAKYLNHPQRSEVRFSAPPGLRIASQGARVLHARRPAQIEKTLSRYLHEAVATTWITGHWTAEDTLNTLLAHEYFGLRQDGIEEAAKAYFDKTPLQLEIHEIALLMAIQKGPSAYDPWCHREKAMAQANVIVDLLTINWPQKYQKLEKVKTIPDSLINKKSVLCGGR